MAGYILLRIGDELQLFLSPRGTSPGYYFSLSTLLKPAMALGAICALAITLLLLTTSDYPTTGILIIFLTTILTGFFMSYISYCRTWDSFASLSPIGGGFLGASLGMACLSKFEAWMNKQKQKEDIHEITS